MKKRGTIKLILVILTITMFFSACNLGTKDDGSDENLENTTTDNTNSNANANTLAYANEIDKTAIMSFEISVNEDDWQTMLDNAQKEEYISADITINGTKMENVGIRPKGNSSLSSIARDDTTDRYSFKIKFDKYVDGQTWLGLDKIVLNNNYSDATSMKEYLSYDIMSYIGVDSSLFAYADIKVNGESWGFYLAVEDVDSGFLERVKGDEGELYKPESMDMGNMGGGNMPQGNRDPFSADENSNDSSSEPPQIPEGEAGDSSFQPPQMPDGEEGRGFNNRGGGGGMGASDGVSLKYTDDEESSYSAIFDNAETKTDEEDHKRVIEAIKNLNEGTELEKYIDVDAVLRYLAAHTVVVNLDSYSGNMGHNYYLYENNGQISIIPWDYNMAFGGFQSGSASDVVNFPIDTPVSGVSMEDRPLISKLLEVPEYLEKYHQYLQEIVDGYFADGKFEVKIDELNALISDGIKNDPTAFYTYEEYEAAITELKKLGTLRGESIQGQLEGTVPSTIDGQESEPDKLIDASSIDMSALGGGFGGNDGPGGMGGGRNFDMPDGMNMDTIREAMEIIQSAQGGELTDEQRAQLEELGLTDEQIEQMMQMPNGMRNR